ncbi:hypothetical protein [Sulfurimonas sp. HSL3-7]|uniref:hypothetical protein n=1 Tax=Sulfonitrofixus jiaomeiensis TaxID=3131938 RepID=UPI0031FA35BE
MKHLSTIGSAALLGSMGVAVMSVLSGCEAPQQEPQNRFLVIEQQPGGKYIVVEEMPTEGPSRAIIRERDENGIVTERFMSEEEMRRLAEQEYQKMQNGQSELNSAPSGEGMGLAGTILAVAAGSLLGNMIGNALMGNKNFQRHSNTVNKSAYHQNAAKRAAAGGSKRSFFGGSKTGSSSTRSSSFGG